MGLLFDLETRLEQELPLRLQGNLQESLNSYRPQCRKCGLVMHRHHRYSRSIATRYGVVELQVPVFLCGDCHSMTSGAELLGDEERYRRYSKNCRLGREIGCLGVELRPGRPTGGQRQEHSLPLGQTGGSERADAVGRVWELDGSGPGPVPDLGGVVKRVWSRSWLPVVGRRPGMTPPSWHSGSLFRATA